MLPLSTGYAHSHPLNTDVKEHRSGQTAENHPQHLAVPGSTRLLWNSRAIAAVGSPPPPTASSVAVRRRSCVPGLLQEILFLRCLLWRSGKRWQYCTFIPLLPIANFVNGKERGYKKLSKSWGCPGLSEPLIFMWFSAACRFKRLIPIWQIQLHCDLWAGASVAIPVPPWEKEGNRLK